MPIIIPEKPADPNAKPAAITVAPWKNYVTPIFRIGGTIAGGIGGALAGGALATPADVVSGPAGTAAGALWGGRVGAALGGGAGETIAQMIEQGTMDPHKLSGKKIALETALSAVPGDKLVKAGRWGQSALRSAAFGELGQVTRRAVDSGDPADLVPKPGDALSTPVIMGGALGAGVGKLAGMTKAGKATTAAEDATAQARKAGRMSEKVVVEKYNKGETLTPDEWQFIKKTSEQQKPTTPTTAAGVLKQEAGKDAAHETGKKLRQTEVEKAATRQAAADKLKKAKADQEIAAAELLRRKAGTEAYEGPVRETITATVPGGKESGTTTWLPKDPTQRVVTGVNPKPPQGSVKPQPTGTPPPRPTPPKSAGSSSTPAAAARGATTITDLGTPPATPVTPTQLPSGVLSAERGLPAAFRDDSSIMAQLLKRAEAPPPGAHAATPVRGLPPTQNLDTLLTSPEASAPVTSLEKGSDSLDAMLHSPAAAAPIDPLLGDAVELPPQGSAPRSKGARAPIPVSSTTPAPSTSSSVAAQLEAPAPADLPGVEAEQRAVWNGRQPAPELSPEVAALLGETSPASTGPAAPITSGANPLAALQTAEDAMKQADTAYGVAAEALKRGEGSDEARKAAGKAFGKAQSDLKKARAAAGAPTQPEVVPPAPAPAPTARTVSGSLKVSGVDQTSAARAKAVAANKLKFEAKQAAKAAEKAAVDPANAELDAISAALGPRTAAEAPATAATTAGLTEDVANLAQMAPEQRRAAISKMISDQGGQASVRAATSIAGGLGGAAYGAASADPEQGESRLGRAAMFGALGAGAGYAAPSVISKLMGEGPGAPISEQIEDAAIKLGKRMPNIQRFNFLSNPSSLGANAVAGPWAGGALGSLEQYLTGKAMGDVGRTEAGADAMRGFASGKFFREGVDSLPEAAERLNQSAGGGERIGSGGWDIDLSGPAGYGKTAVAAPGLLMTAGDIAARKIMTDAGIPEEMARRITLTSEAKSPTLKGIQNSGKGKTAGGKSQIMWNMMLPFKRTTANVVEQGLERTPVVGELFQRFAKDAQDRDPGLARVVQQGMGGVVWVGAEQLGENTDPETAKWLRKYVSNMGGQYSLLASAGFATGQAVRAGKGNSLMDMAGHSAKSMLNATPLPSTDVPLDYINSALEMLKNGPSVEAMPRGLKPGIVYNDSTLPTMSAIAEMMQDAAGNSPAPGPGLNFNRQ